MLAAVQATDERLIAPGYLMQISAHLALSYTKRVLLALLNTCRRILEWIKFALSSFPTKKRIIACCLLRDEFNGKVTKCNVHK